MKVSVMFVYLSVLPISQSPARHSRCLQATNNCFFPPSLPHESESLSRTVDHISLDFNLHIPVIRLLLVQKSYTNTLSEFHSSLVTIFLPSPQFPYKWSEIYLGQKLVRSRGIGRGDSSPPPRIFGRYHDGYGSTSFIKWIRDLSNFIAVILQTCSITIQQIKSRIKEIN